MSEKIVGHKTLVDESGNRTHKPLYKSEADEIMRRIEEADKRRTELMPDEKSAIKMFNEAFNRLKELGWNDACYCPKDGQIFDVIEAGSTGIHKCNYDGDWPKGSYWIHASDGLWPSKPVLFKAIIKDSQTKSQP